MDYTCIQQLPREILAEDPEGGVLRPWVRKLGLRHQGVIITALRGCDIANKEDFSNKRNNDPSNLEVMTKEEHTRLHIELRRQRREQLRKVS